MFDKLPIWAFLSRAEIPNPDLPLNILWFWCAMDYGIVAVHKQFIGSMDFEVLTRDFGLQKGTYVATLDNYHADINAIDYSTAETPDEHKSFNLLELDNGQYCVYPNNRMRVYDNSLTPHEPLRPDFKVSTIEYQVENGNQTRLGDTDEYFWKTKQESSD